MSYSYTIFPTAQTMAIGLDGYDEPDFLEKTVWGQNCHHLPHSYTPEQRVQNGNKFQNLSDYETWWHQTEYIPADDINSIPGNYFDVDFCKSMISIEQGIGGKAQLHQLQLANTQNTGSHYQYQDSTGHGSGVSKILATKCSEAGPSGRQYFYSDKGLHEKHFSHLLFGTGEHKRLAGATATVEHTPNTHEQHLLYNDSDPGLYGGNDLNQEGEMGDEGEFCVTEEPSLLGHDNSLVTYTRDRPTLTGWTATPPAEGLSFTATGESDVPLTSTAIVGQFSDSVKTKHSTSPQPTPEPSTTRLHKRKACRAFELVSTNGRCNFVVHKAGTVGESGEVRKDDELCGAKRPPNKLLEHWLTTHAYQEARDMAAKRLERYGGQIVTSKNRLDFLLACSGKCPILRCSQTKHKPRGSFVGYSRKDTLKRHLKTHMENNELTLNEFQKLSERFTLLPKEKKVFKTWYQKIICQVFDIVD
ncbi:hypothetical protein BU17DRAFT_92793 [Hysterangium stoloniferum]|nr:hypothetical protein BU17DRAFT_92793 [Hysterangium stoloniferum]